MDHDVADDLALLALALARRFAAGATMWCVSPEWPAHGRHLAVEFVHPVIVGKRALPAAYAGSEDPTGTLRLLARPGDVVVAIAAADDTTVVDLMRRADAWGLLGVWIGAGARPPLGAADHVIWLESANAEAPWTGPLVTLYHLLWELTHVVFEHPGLLTVTPECTGDVCITCADEGRLAEVARTVGDHQASVRSSAGRETIDVSLVGSVAAGDLVLVHAGVAVTKVGP